jgi:hypothetical protein
MLPLGGIVASMRWPALVLVSAVALHATTAGAQTEDALSTARRLFTEAVADQDARRYETALEKFRRVDAVKETANVLYRIASCLEALGRKAEALAAYDAVVKMGGQDVASAEAVQVSRARATQLEASVARLSVLVPADAPADTEVRIDDAPIERASLGTSLPLEPGRHTLRATAVGHTPFDTAMQLTAGGRVAITVTLQRTPASEPGLPPPAAQPAPAPPPEAGPPVGAWVAFGVGGLLAAGSVVSLVLRSSNLSTLDRDCSSTPSGTLTCPSSRADEVNGAHDAAKIEGPLGIALGAGAAVALGVGTWLLFSGPSRDASALVVMPLLAPQGAGVLVRGSLGAE